MRSAMGERAVGLVESVLSSGPMATTKVVAEEIVDVLEREGLIARCSCPVGFGQVHDPRCPAHGRRDPAHTIEGVRT